MQLHRFAPIFLQPASQSDRAWARQPIQRLEATGPAEVLPPVRKSILPLKICGLQCPSLDFTALDQRSARHWKQRGQLRLLRVSGNTARKSSRGSESAQYRQPGYVRPRKSIGRDAPGVRPRPRLRLQPPSEPCCCMAPCCCIARCINAWYSCCAVCSCSISCSVFGFCSDIASISSSLRLWSSA